MSLIANKVHTCTACGEPIMIAEAYCTDGNFGMTHLECVQDNRKSITYNPINTND